MFSACRSSFLFDLSDNRLTFNNIQSAVGQATKMFPLVIRDGSQVSSPM